MPVLSFIRLPRAALPLGLVVAGLVVAGTALAVSRDWTVQSSPNPSSSDNSLVGVAATSAKDAWAVGSYQQMGGSTSQTLIEHWNGQGWTVSPSSSPSNISFNFLKAVAATSAKNAWAAGYYHIKNGADKTLIEHWNGKSWKVEPTPNAPGDSWPHDTDELFGVAATSSKNAWAVGYFDNGYVFQPVIEHWNGARWVIQPSPNPGSYGNELFSVAATSPTNAWSVGIHHDDSPFDQTLIERWNGKAWKRVLSPNHGTLQDELLSVAATSATNAWAVGYYENTSGANEPLIEHWNGKAWKLVLSPKRGSDGDELLGVAAISAKDAWTVGWYHTSHGFYDTLIEHWNGKSWKVVPTLNPGSNVNELWGVAATSSNAWAVGFSETANGGFDNKTLIEQRSGRG